MLSGERIFILSSFLTLTLFEFWTPICIRVNFLNFQKAKYASHRLSQMSNGSNECLVISETPQICIDNSMLVWFSLTEPLPFFYTVILTRSWLNSPNLDPGPGLWRALAVINVRADNLSQKHLLPLPTNSERNQTAPQNWFKPKTLLSGKGFLILSSFLTQPFSSFGPLYANGLIF